MKTSKLILVILIVGLLSNFILADDNYFSGGAGGFEVIYLPLDIDRIDSKLNQVNLPGLPNNIYLTGGGGWGNIGSNVRIGFYAYGGSLDINNKVDGIAREFKFELSAGGFAVEKAFHPLSLGEIYIGCTIGAGEMNLKLNKWTDIPTWETVWNGYDPEAIQNGATPGSYSSNMSNSFFMAAPSLGLRYHLLDWFAIGANVGYFYTFMEEDNWEVDGRTLINAPEIDMSNVIYKVNFFFGG